MALDVPRLSTENVASVVRTWMRDHAELNRLLAGEETGDRLLATCVAKAIDFFNTTGPPISVTVDTFPSMSLLMDLTACEVLQSVMFIKMRNYLLFNDGGTVNTEANIELYERTIGRMRQLAMPQIDSLKVSLNIMGALNGNDSVSSEYAWLSGWVNAFGSAN